MGFSLVEAGLSFYIFLLSANTGYQRVLTGSGHCQNLISVRKGCVLFIIRQEPDEGTFLVFSDEERNVIFNIGNVPLFYMLQNADSPLSVIHIPRLPIGSHSISHQPLQRGARPSSSAEMTDLWTSTRCGRNTSTASGIWNVGSSSPYRRWLYQSVLLIQIKFGEAKTRLWPSRSNPYSQPAEVSGLSKGNSHYSILKYFQKEVLTGSFHWRISVGC